MYVYICIYLYACTYVFVYMIMYIRRALFQNVLSTNPQIEVAMAMPLSKIMFWKRALHTYVHKYAFIHMSKALLSNIIITFGIGIAMPFLGMALNAFRKIALEIYMYIYIYIYICNLSI